MDIEQIRRLCAEKPFIMSQHAELRRRQRGISVREIRQAIAHGTIIEDYPDAYPYPACLILAWVGQRPLHVVCGVAEGTLWIITVYQPNDTEWESDYQTRKGGQS